MEPESYQNSAQKLRIRDLYFYSKAGSCPCCHNPQFYSWAFSKKKITAETYELLLLLGWIKCGDYYYKPNLQKNCCKMWGYRQNVTQFNIKKDQKKTIRKMMNFLKSNQEIDTYEEKEEKKQSEKVEKINEQKMIKNVSQIPQNDMITLKNLTQKLTIFLKQNKQLLLKCIGAQNMISDDLDLHQINQKIKYFKSKENEKYNYYCNFFMLLFGVNKKRFIKSFSVAQFVKNIKELILNRVESEGVYKFQIEKSGYLLIGTKQQQKLNEMASQNTKNSFKCETKKNKMKTSMISEEEKQPQKQQQYFKITEDVITFGDITIFMLEPQFCEQGLNLYLLNEQAVHKKETDKNSYIKSYCDNGIVKEQKITQRICEEKYTPSWDPQGKYQKPQQIKGQRKKKLGCYHMKYYLKDELIAISVVDMIPSGLVSEYFFYNPKYKKCRLGVFSSLIQIQYIRWLQMSFPEFKYCYLGMYIQNNSKLNYKANYAPFQLLCPITGHFVLYTPELKDLVSKIENKQINSVQLAHRNTLKWYDLRTPIDIDAFIEANALFQVQKKLVRFSQIPPYINDFMYRLFINFLPAWGKTFFRKIIFVIDQY